MKFLSLVLLGTFFSIHVAHAADGPVIDMSDETRTLHPQPMVGEIPIEPAFEDYMFMLFDTCEAAGIKCSIYPMMGAIYNAAAFQDAAGNRIVVFDRELSPRLGYFGASAAIAHEIGHHYCLHLSDRRSIGKWQREAEADAFMAYAMKRQQVSISALVEMFEELGFDEASETHPSLSARVVQIAHGFEANSLSDICPGKDPN